MKRLKKIEKLIISGFLGVLLALAAGCPDPAGGGSADFVPVVGITGVPVAGVKNSPIDLSKAAVSPAGATNKTILWSVAEGSAVKADADGAVFTPKEAGTLTLAAAVKDGLSEKTDYTEEFTLTVSAGHVPVTGITGVPSGGVKGAVIDLSKAAVSPAGATYKTIEWSIEDPGRTALARGLAGTAFTPDHEGAAVIRGTVRNGTAEGVDYTEDFTLAIAASHVPVRGITGVPAAAALGAAIDLSGAAVVPEDATDKGIAWSVAPGSAVHAAVDGALITPESTGTLKLAAAVAQGKSGSEAYTQVFSIEVSPPAPGAPGAPVLAAGDRQISAAWAGVESAEAYEVWYGTSSDSGQAAQSGGDVRGTSAVITGLANGTVYYVRIKAKNAAGASGFSPPATATPEAGETSEPPGAPGAPALVAGDRQISVAWAGVETAEAYEVWYGTSSDSGQAAQSGGDVSGTSAVITGLTNLQTYYVRIKAKNAAGASGFSPPATAVPHEAGLIPLGGAGDLAKIGSEGFPMGGAYILLEDIELNGWDPIGAVSDPFTGTFDGNGRTVTITGFSADALSRNVYLGIFAYVKGESAAAKANIKNLRIVSSVNQVSGRFTGQAVGLIAGFAENAEIDGIILTGTFAYQSSKTLYLGGAVGVLNGGVLKNCSGSMTMDIKPGNGEVPGVGYSLNPYNFIGGFAGLFQNAAGIENCHNTGDVSATSEVALSQIFVGGVAGGSFFSWLSDNGYRGYIIDSSSIGNITGRAKHYWTFAGGIAGCSEGGSQMNAGNDGATTRIVRCYAKGTISAVGTGSGWIYIGGIVGYNNFALVSQCRFEGAVEIDRGNDYTGGIAGHSNHSNSRIEDCWSSGTVKGNKNAGGIVGIYSAIGGGVYNCYSLSAITVNAGAGETGEASGQSAGGIVGQARSGGDITGTIALNPSISAPNGFGRLGRVAGEADSYVSFSDNYARTDMSVTVSGAAPAEPFPDRVDGLDCAERPTQAFYENLGWNFRDVWKMDTSGGYPVLKQQH